MAFEADSNEGRSWLGTDTNFSVEMWGWEQSPLSWAASPSYLQLSPSDGNNLHHWPKCGHFLHLQPFHHPKSLLFSFSIRLFCKILSITENQILTRRGSQLFNKWEKLQSIKQYILENFIDQSEFLERKTDLVEREEQKKSKLAEMWSGLHSFNLKSERSQEHRKSFTKEKQKVFLRLIPRLVASTRS